jgi:response regulator NasT
VSAGPAATTLRILIVDQDPARAAVLEQALADAGHRVVGRTADQGSLLRIVTDTQPDVVIIDMDAPGRDTLEDLREVGRDNPKPIIMFSNNRDGDYIRQAVQAGVSAYVVDGLSKERILPIVEVAIARFREFQALRRELAETRVQLADRKIVDKAKGILIQRKGLTEEQAYALLRKTAMNRGLRIADVARTLLSLEGVDG